MIEIEGTYGEGGGQILRSALALSVVTKQPFRITHIRQNRSIPGLKKQHLTAIQVLEHLCSAKVSSYEIGTTELVFEPGDYKPQYMDIDIGTAGSITLLLQSLLLPMIFARGETTLSIRGGTDVKWTMPIDYFIQVVLPHLISYAKIICQVHSRGFFPKGNGQVELRVCPTGKTDRIVLMKQGKLQDIRGKAFASLPLSHAEVSERMAHQAQTELEQFGCRVHIEAEYSESFSTGAGIVLWSIHSTPAILGADALGERGLPSEKVASIAVKRLKKEIESGAAVDQHLADNLIPFLGMLGGEIKASKVSSHTLSNIYITETFLGVKFDVDKDSGRISQQ